MRKTKFMAILLCVTMVLSGCGSMNNTTKGGLLGGGGGAVLAAGLVPDQVLRQQDLSGDHGLPAHAGALIQGVSSTCRTLLLDDRLQTAACDLCDTIGVCTHYECAVYAVCDIGFGCFHKAYACDLADFTFIDVFRLCILVCIDPFGIRHEVMRCIGMDDRHIAAIDLGCVVLLQESKN